MARRQESRGGGAGGEILPFPADPREDGLLVERLRGDNGSLVCHAIADWADPLDAAILAACLLERPADGIRRRERAARLARRTAEAAFWRETEALLAAITGQAGQRR